MAWPGLRVMSFPSKVTVPPFDGSRPVMVCSVVVLPAPFAPMSATTSPSFTSKETSRERMNQAVVNVDVLDFEHCHKLVSSSLIRPDKP